MIRKSTKVATDAEFFEWYTNQVEKEKETQSGEQFLEMLKNNPKALEESIKHSLHQVIMFACIDLNAAVVGHTSMAEPLVAHLKNHFYPVA